jgi:Spy/CpxP family protein refolding chaperone
MMNSRLFSTSFAAAALTATLMLTAPAASQAQEPTTDQIKMIIEAARSEMRASREALVAANLELTAAEADKFWPLYREYNTKKASLGDERLKIIMDYAEAYPDVSDAVAKGLVDRSVKNSKAFDKLRYGYVDKLGKVLPASKLMRFLQIESRIDNLIELKIQQGVPVVDPATK